MYESEHEKPKAPHHVVAHLKHTHPGTNHYAVIRMLVECAADAGLDGLRDVGCTFWSTGKIADGDSRNCTTCEGQGFVGEAAPTPPPPAKLDRSDHPRVVP